MNKALKISNIVFASITLISIIFASLLFNLNSTPNGYVSSNTQLELIYGALLGSFGMGSYLGLLIIGSIMVHLYRTKKDGSKTVLINGILNIIFGAAYIIGTAISHMLGGWAEILTMVMDCLSIGLIYLSILVYQNKQIINKN